MMKRIFFLILLCASFATGEEFIPSAPIQNLEDSDQDRSQFIYLAGGVNPLPTISIGYRKLYKSLGSDISISSSFWPFAACGKRGVIPIPGVQYKQLFFSRNGWRDMKTGSSTFYLGAATAVYPFTRSMCVGGLAGWQFKRKSGCDFFELGMNPVAYVDKKIAIVPLGSLTYAFMF